MNIIAVVVTYNRMELLKRNIRCLQQNKPISSIVIVNNGSTDGTTEWLAAQEGLTVINQTNVGGAGGFYTGIQYAYQAGADWIWCMDDDVFPRADCLEQLLPYTGKKDIGILAPRRLLEGEIFTHDFQAYNLSILLYPCTARNWQDGTSPHRQKLREQLSKVRSSAVKSLRR